MSRSDNRLCSLTDLESLAKTRFGDRAPSYPTLKRWARSGRLDEAQFRQGTGRVLYQADRALESVARFLRQPGSSAPAPSPAGQGSTATGGAQMSPASAAANGEVVEELRHLQAKVDELKGIVLSMSRFASDLAEARKMLMVKTDTEVTLWRERALAAEAAARRLQETTLADARAQRLNGATSVSAQTPRTHRSSIVDYDDV